ncbi:MAG TPA: GNAT family N-acetyltransferase [Myxococcaceae bacterium]|nr:GNAT family N-acetyltransferase [Myxococcaceae bacterium]
MSSLELEPIPAAEAQALRQQLQSPLPAGRWTFDGDTAADTLHLAASVEGERVGVVSALRESLPEDGVRRGFRVRGLCVAEAHRRKGYGSQLLDGCRAHAKAHDGSELWAYVMPEAAGFFSRQGFVTEGPPELHDDLGPRVTMRRFHLDAD